MLEDDVTETRNFAERRPTDGCVASMVANVVVLALVFDPVRGYYAIAQSSTLQLTLQGGLLRALAALAAVIITSTDFRDGRQAVRGLFTMGVSLALIWVVGWHGDTLYEYNFRFLLPKITEPILAALAFRVLGLLVPHVAIAPISSPHSRADVQHFQFSTRTLFAITFVAACYLALPTSALNGTVVFEWLYPHDGVVDSNLKECSVTVALMFVALARRRMIFYFLSVALGLGLVWYLLNPERAEEHTLRSIRDWGSTFFGIGLIAFPWTLAGFRTRFSRPLFG